MERAWYVAAENETVQGIARRLDMTAFDLVNMNTRVYGLTTTSSCRAVGLTFACSQRTCASTEPTCRSARRRRSASASRVRLVAQRGQPSGSAVRSAATSATSSKRPHKLRPTPRLRRRRRFSRCRVCRSRPCKGCLSRRRRSSRRQRRRFEPAAVPPPPACCSRARPPTPPPPPPPPPQHQQPVPAAAAALPPVRLSQLEARLSLTAAPSGLMPRVEQLEQTFGVTTAGSVPERLTALEAVADSWGI